MLTKIKTKNQVTIPQKALRQLGLGVGDNFSVEIEEGRIILTPKVLVDAATAQMVSEVKASYEEYKNNPDAVKKFTDVDAMFKEMDLE